MGVGPRVLFLHGFASGPNARKAVAVAERLGARGLAVERLNLRVPSLERLSFAAMTEVTRSAIGGPRDRAIVIGSSMGGLVAARLAEEEPRICALILLAPALRFSGSWRGADGAARWDAWLGSGWLETVDRTTGETTRVHAAFAREIEARDRDFPDVRVPTLILHGVDDDVVPIEVSRGFVAAHPHARLIELDDGHELGRTLGAVLDRIEAFLEPILALAPVDGG